MENNMFKKLYHPDKNFAFCKTIKKTYQKHDYSTDKKDHKSIILVFFFLHNLFFLIQKKIYLTKIFSSVIFIAYKSCVEFLIFSIQ